MGRLFLLPLLTLLTGCASVESLNHVTLAQALSPFPVKEATPVSAPAATPPSLPGSEPTVRQIQMQRTSRSPIST